MNSRAIRLLAAGLLLAPVVALALSYPFHIQPSGHLGGKIMFEFRDHLNKKIRPDIAWFTVSERTADRWQPVWSIKGKLRKISVIEYGSDAGSVETPAKELLAGRTYAAFASDGHGGSAMEVFRFNKDGTMTFPRSLE